MIEKNAKVATEEFYRVWAREGEKEITKKKDVLVSSASSSHLPVISDDVPEIPKVLEPESDVHNSGNKDLIAIPFVGVEATPITIATVIFALLFICSGFYFSVRISTIHYELSEWQSEHHEIEDRLLFLQSFVAHLAMNSTKKWGTRQGYDQGLSWRLEEWQEQIQNLQTKLAQTLNEVSDVLSESSSKKLGESGNPFILLDTPQIQQIQTSSKIMEITDVSDSSSWKFIIVLTLLVGLVGGAAFFMTQM